MQKPTKTYEVEVSYMDAQPEDGGTYTKTYTVQAYDSSHAEILAMDKCAREFWSHEPMDATATELFCTSCHNTGYANDGHGDATLCEDCERKPVDEFDHIPQSRHEEAA